VVNLITFGKTDAIHRETLALVDLYAGDAVLDVGCGTGALVTEAERIVGAGGIVVGLDVEPAMVKQAKRRADDRQVVFEVASIDHIPYPDDTFDVVFSTLMYHHLTEVERTTGIEEVRRVLKPGGRLVVVDINPTRRSILTLLPGHSSIEPEDYVRTEVAARMEEASFVVVEDGPHPSKQLSYAIGQKV
jgi:ubiquinone/menaquinone biosynthesis C-methylase UbiE